MIQRITHALNCPGKHRRTSTLLLFPERRASNDHRRGENSRGGGNDAVDNLAARDACGISPQELIILNTKY